MASRGGEASAASDIEASETVAESRDEGGRTTVSAEELRASEEVVERKGAGASPDGTEAGARSGRDDDIVGSEAATGDSDRVVAVVATTPATIATPRIPPTNALQRHRQGDGVGAGSPAAAPVSSEPGGGIGPVSRPSSRSTASGSGS